MHLKSQAANNGLYFRPNKVSDVAKLWLQIIQPWRSDNDFVTSLQELGERRNLFCGYNTQQNLDLGLFNILTHTSIPTLTRPFDFFSNIEGEREKERQLWTGYVREMSVFYFDIFVDYIQALIQQGIYTLDDAVVFNEVIGKRQFLQSLCSRDLQIERTFF